MTRGSAFRAKWMGFMLALALAVLGATVWSGFLRAPFLMDDAPTITENESIRDPAAIGAVLNPPAASSYQGRPLGNLLAAANLALGGPSSYSFHLVNVLIHIAVGLLLFDLVRRTLKTGPLSERYGAKADALAFFSSLVWLLHPLHSAAVGYVTQRIEMLAALFLLLALCALSRLGEGRGGRWAALAVASALLGAATKETAAAIPVVALLYDRAFIAGGFREALGKRRRLYVGLASCWLLLGALMITAGSRNETVGFHPGRPYAEHLFTQAGAYALYLKLALWPSPLVFDYGPLAKPPAYLSWLGMAAVPALAAWTIAKLRANRPEGFAGAVFFAALAPTSSFVPLRETVVEYRMYLPLAALAPLAVCAAWRIGENSVRGRSLAALGLLVAAALGAATLERAEAFSSETALWRDTVAKAPENARARVSLAAYLHERGDLKGALSQLDKAVSLDPSSFRAWSNLGVVGLEAGADREALEALERAKDLRPGDVRNRYHLGRAFMASGRIEEGAAEFGRVLASGKAPPPVLADMADKLAQAGRTGEAAAFYEAAAKRSK